MSEEKLLHRIGSPEELRALSKPEVLQVARELREEIGGSP